jgi:hypothetical protein
MKFPHAARRTPHAARRTPHAARHLMRLLDWKTTGFHHFRRVRRVCVEREIIIVPPAFLRCIVFHCIIMRACSRIQPEYFFCVVNPI